MSYATEYQECKMNRVSLIHVHRSEWFANTLEMHPAKKVTFVTLQQVLLKFPTYFSIKMVPDKLRGVICKQLFATHAIHANLVSMLRVNCSSKIKPLTP